MGTDILCGFMSALLDKVPLVAGAIKTIEEVAPLSVYILSYMFIHTYMYICVRACVCV